MRAAEFLGKWILLFIGCLGVSALALADTGEEILLTLEEPAGSATYSGVSNIRGWALAPNGIARIEFFFDNKAPQIIPFGGSRRDVANDFPGYPDAAESGFSMAFNYSNLTAGEHTLSVRAFDNNGDFSERTVSFVVERFEETFVAEPDSVNLGGANIRSDNEQTLFIDNVAINGKRYDLVLKWRPATQDFEVLQIERK